MTELPNTPVQKESADFKELLHEGLQLLRKVQTPWTDHNPSDPGITILEQLCYALSDLSYRAAFEIPDLLAEEGRATYGSLFSPRTILGSRPVTPTDIRALLIDLPEVKNAWLASKEEGVYAKLKSSGIQENWEQSHIPIFEGVTVTFSGAFIIQVETVHADLSEEEKNALQSKIFRLIHANRNLGADFRKEDILLLPVEEINVLASVEMEPGRQPEQILASILQRLQQFIAPQLPFYTLQEMLSRGKRMEEIFEGPMLRHGFIDQGELKKFDKKSHLRSSDLISEMMDVPGVKAVTSLQMQSENSNGQSDPWEMQLDPSKAPSLKIPKDLASSSKPLSIKLTMNGLPVGIDRTLLDRLFQRVSEVKPVAPPIQDVFPPASRDRNIADYYSIQHHFPDTYGVNEAGLPDSAPTDRKAKARRLKAYLLFFDQILATAFAQLAHARHLLAFEDGSSYASRLLADQNGPNAKLGLDALLEQSPEDHLAFLEDLIDPSGLRLQRKNQFLDHLLARFQEDLQSYALLLYQLMEDDWLWASEKLIADKVRLLQEYPALSANRSGGFDVCLPANEKGNVSFFKKRICRLIGIENCERVWISPVKYREYYDLDENDKTTRHWEITNIYSGVVLLNDFMLKKPELKKPGGITFPIPGGSLLKGGVLTPPIIPPTSFGQLPGGFQLLGDIGTQWTEEALIEHQEIEKLLESLDILKETKENLHIIEHILLRPVPGKPTRLTKVYAKDPYSLQLSIVLPEWAGRLQYEDFRKLAEQTLEGERPAHLGIRFLWLNAIHMGDFEARYQAWLRGLEKYLLTDGEAHHEFRTARNRLIDCLDIGYTYPLPDLPVFPESNTYYQEEQPLIFVDHTEKDVWYLLWYKDQEEGQWNPTEARLRSPGGQIQLFAPPLYQDALVYYRIEARKFIKGYTLQGWLAEELIIYIGVNKNLNIHFGEGAKTVLIDYNTTATAILKESQDSITYQLFADETGEMAISSKQFGNGKDLPIQVDPDPDPEENFKEDLETIFVQAYKDLDQDEEPDDPEHIFMIPTDLNIQVRPNPAVTFTPEYQIVDFLGKATLEIPKPQSSAAYRVGTLELPFDAFSFEPPASWNFLTALNEQEEPVYIRADFLYDGPFLEGDPLQTSELAEDSLLFVEAYKENGSAQLLHPKAVVLVRPKPTVSIQWPQSPVKAGELAHIILTKTQKGVHYQLYLEEDGEQIPVGKPGYHFEDRAIETMRIGIDLLLDHDSEEELYLPTGVLETVGNYTFHIFAIKTRTGVRQELEGSPGTIEVIG